MDSGVLTTPPYPPALDGRSDERRPSARRPGRDDRHLAGLEPAAPDDRPEPAHQPRRRLAVHVRMGLADAARRPTRSKSTLELVPDGRAAHGPDRDRRLREARRRHADPAGRSRARRSRRIRRAACDRGSGRQQIRSAWSAAPVERRRRRGRRRAADRPERTTDLPGHGGVHRHTTVAAPRTVGGRRGGGGGGACAGRSSSSRSTEPCPATARA